MSDRCRSCDDPIVDDDELDEGLCRPCQFDVQEAADLSNQMRWDG